MTTKSTHTPGPWSRAINPECDNQHEVHAGPVCVATCGTGNEAAANAQLIASAPDLLRQRDQLLAALKLALGQLEGVKSLSAAHSSSLRADIAIARQAIAQAAKGQP